MLMVFDLNPGTRFKKVRGVWWANFGDTALPNRDLNELVQAVAKAQGITK